MIDKKVSATELKKKTGVSGNIISRLKKDEYVSMCSIEKICEVLKCSVDDILEFVKRDEQ